MVNSEFFGTEKISRILLRLAPPVMLAQLIQALYNMVDSMFIGRFSDTGLTALSIVYPLQLLMIALAVGTGVGINTVMASKLGEGRAGEANEYAGVGTPLAALLWLAFAAICYALMPLYARLSTSSEAIIADVVAYGRIVCVFSFGLFLESVWTKVLQAEGDMKTPTVAQILGAVTNIILDPILIFGLLGAPRLGITGAAIATVCGQIVAAAVVFRRGFRASPSLHLYPGHIAKIFRLGTPNILMQSAYTLYIFGLNLILAEFSDQAVTTLGLYYKWQSIFFIPLGAMQTCIVPVISYNYAARKIERCRRTLKDALVFGMALMFIGTVCFIAVPGQMLRVFTSDELVIEIGRVAFPIIGVSFIPLVSSLTFPVFFQAVGSSLKSSLLTVVRTVVLFVPLAYVFSRFGLDYFWFTYPVTEVITTAVGYIFYRSFLRQDYVRNAPSPLPDTDGVPALRPSRPGVIITIARRHGSSGKQVGKLVSEKLGIPFYYKEMIALAAHESGLDQEFISNIHRNSPDILRELYLSNRAVQYAIRAQDVIIRKIAAAGSCVIVGRAADYVLRENDNVLRVFVTAPEELRIRRVSEIYGDTHRQARHSVRRSDKARASYYRHISGRRWDDEKNYDLVVDSSCGVEEAAERIVSFVERCSCTAAR